MNGNSSKNVHFVDMDINEPCCEDFWDYIFDWLTNSVEEINSNAKEVFETCCRFVGDARDLIIFLFF